MSSEKLVPIDEDLHDELIDIYEDLMQDVERATGLEYGEFGNGVDPSIAEQAMLIIDKVLTAYDYYSSKDGQEPEPEVPILRVRPKGSTNSGGNDQRGKRRSQGDGPN